MVKDQDSLQDLDTAQCVGGQVEEQGRVTDQPPEVPMWTARATRESGEPGTCSCWSQAAGGGAGRDLPQAVAAAPGGGPGLALVFRPVLGQKRWMWSGELA